LKFASFATPKTLIIVFRGGSTMETADRRLRNECRAYHEYAMFLGSIILNVMVK